jgi:putative tricarboxylic transport membrane protein
MTDPAGSAAGSAAGGRAGSLAIAAFFIVAGLVTLYDTTTYADLDSKVFPRAAAIVLIIASLITFLLNLFRPVHEAGFGQGSWWRRLLLVSTLLLACAAMPYIGFLAAGFIAFAGGMVASLHQRLSLKSLVGMAAAGAAIMVAFHALFRFVLHVPLP